MEREELDITAQLARLELADDEKKRFEQAVFQMLEYFSKMKEFDVEGLPPTAQMTQNNRTRKDAAIENKNTEAILGNAPELEDRFIVITNVDTVIVDGKTVKQNGVITMKGEEKILEDAQNTTTEIWENLFRESPELMNLIKVK
jgi:aspartyl-tRNA(Asn)/glutamyl-tRNA(Gln) amidotransferase subunit C